MSSEQEYTDAPQDEEPKKRPRITAAYAPKTDDPPSPYDPGRRYVGGQRYEPGQGHLSDNSRSEYSRGQSSRPRSFNQDDIGNRAPSQGGDRGYSTGASRDRRDRRDSGSGRDSGTYSSGGRDSDSGRDSGGQRDRRESSNSSGGRDSGGFSGGQRDRRDSGYSEGGREGGFRERRDSSSRPREEGGFRERREGGHSSGSREGGVRERRDSSFRPREEGGFRERRESSFRSRDEGGFRERREGGFRESGFRDRGFRAGGGSSHDSRSRFTKTRSGRKFIRMSPPPAKPITVLRALVKLHFASRRFALEAIQNGRVWMGDQLVKSPNIVVNLGEVTLTVDNFKLNRKAVEEKRDAVTILFHKPKGLIGSREAGKQTLYSFLPKRRGWFIPMGVLDKASGGLVILSTDERHKTPEESFFFNLPRIYHIKVHKSPTKQSLQKIENSLKVLTPDKDVKLEIVRKSARHTWLSLSIQQVNLSQVRAILKTAELEIVAFERFAIGSFTTDELKPGAWRRFTANEMAGLSGEDVDAFGVKPAPPRKGVRKQMPPEEMVDSFWKSFKERWLRK